jgi:hypothetical protein
MTRTQRFKAAVWERLHAVSPSLERALKRRFSRSCHENWGYRTRLARLCPDNTHIPRVPDAGRIAGQFQIMHNGLKVVRGSYYSADSERLFRKNKGVHEPQEERIFQEVLKVIPPGGVMMELGAYWAFYSMWFCQQVSQGRAYLIEPIAENLTCGQKNFAANSLTGHFTQAYVGATTGIAPDGTPIMCVDDFVDQHQISHLALLHSDIQGAELDMLHGSARTMAREGISWIFVSTHSDELRDNRFLIAASVNTSQSYSVDGVLVARAPQAPPVPPITLALRP